LRRTNLATLHHPRPEKLLHQLQDVPIGNHVGQFTHDGGVRQVVEESGNIGIEHPTVPLPPQFQDFLHRIMAASSGPKAIRMIVKPRLEDRVQQAPQHLLRNPISDCRPVFLEILARGRNFVALASLGI